MQTIGLLGGIGPQATMDLEHRIHRVSQALIPPRLAFGYPPMVVVYLRESPFLMEASGRPVLPPRPHPKLLEAAESLGRLASFLVIAANGPHVFQRDIEERAGKPVLSMIDCTFREIAARAPSKVGVLAFMSPAVYAQPLTERGIAWVSPPDAVQRHLDQAIIAVWEGRDGRAEVDATLAAVDAVRSDGADLIVLGCTELPVLLRGNDSASDIVNPTQLLAEAAVRRAIAPPPNRDGA